MGWTSSSSWQTRQDIVADRIRGSISKDGTRWNCLSHTLRGNVLWTVWEVSHPTFTKRFIGCDLLQKLEEGWAYKDMDESCHPYYYTCPVSYLDKVPEVMNQAWRDKVIAYHRLRVLKLKPGMIVGLKDCVVPAIELVENRKYWVGKSKDGKFYQVKKDHLTGVVYENWGEVYAA